MPAPAEAAWDGLPPGHGFTCVFDLDKGWKGDIKIQRGERCRVMQLDIIPSLTTSSYLCSVRRKEGETRLTWSEA